MALALLIVSSTSAWSPGTMLLGVYYGDQGWKMDQVKALEGWQGKRDAVVVLFTAFDTSNHGMTNLFGQQLPNIWANGNVPLITWEPYTSRNTPADIESKIAAGSYDSYLLAWGGRLRTFLAGPDGAYGNADDRRVYLRLAHEPNGNWYPWSAGGTTSPATYIAMWQHVHLLLDGLALDPTHLQWVWAVNHEDVGNFAAEEYFPGDLWIDWIAIDGYNWGTSQAWSSWTAPSDVFSSMAGRLRALSTRPLAITETASSSATTAGANAALKAQWITQLFSWAETSDVRMICWFNEDKETDWQTFGGSLGDGTYKVGRTTYKVYGSYRTAAIQSARLASNVSNPRLLTDGQFAGQ